MTIFTLKNNRIMISGEYAFYMFQSYGITPDLLKEWFNKDKQTWINLMKQNG